MHVIPNTEEKVFQENKQIFQETKEEPQEIHKTITAIFTTEYSKTETQH